MNNELNDKIDAAINESENKIDIKALSSKIVGSVDITDEYAKSCLWKKSKRCCAVALRE